jgi:SEC-C motif
MHTGGDMTSSGSTDLGGAVARQKAALGGARSGRGFRYQDAVAAAMAIIGFVEHTPWTISPEADEDITIRHGAGQVIEVQAKSRRSSKADLTASDVMRELVAVWGRHVDRLAYEDVHVCLVVDRVPTGCTPTGLGGSLADYPTVGASALAAVGAAAGRSAEDLRARSHLLVGVAPAAFATGLLADHLSVLPIEAEVLFRQVLAQIGVLVDRRADGYGPGALTPNEVARLIEEGQRIVDVAAIEAPLRSGVCEFIDFETPVHDPAFYLGVDVVAGHIAAGLVTDRPSEVDRCLETIGRTGTAIVTGPSGIGKTAVAYLAARSTRHLVRWIRVREAGSAFDLIKLTEALRASRHAPVGLLVDDIGRIGASMWDSLVQRTRDHDGVFVLGTTREEDVDLLVEAAESIVVRPKLDEELAQAIWAHLLEEGATTSAGWIEAFDQSDGLTLEFVHYLTTGVRLPETVSKQVRQRRQERRDHELQLLRVVSMAASSGAVVDLRRFATEFRLTDEAVQRALVRVVDEHLVRSVGPNEITGLHRLRSEALLHATHDAPPPSFDETAAAAMRCTSTSDLPEFTADLFARGLLSLPGIYEALNRRLQGDPTSITLAGCLDGLRLAALREYSSAVRHVLDRNDVPLALRHIAVGMALVQDRGISDTFEPRLAASLPEIRELKPGDLRSAWLEQVPSELLSRSAICTTTENGIALVLALGGLPEATDLVLDVLRHTPKPSSAESIAQFLDAARMVNGRMASAALTAVGGIAHLLDLAKAQPWVAHLEVRDERTQEGDSQRVLEFHLLCVEEGIADDAHSAVVDLCRLYMGLFPDIDVVCGKAVDASGELVGFRGFNIADKRIPRSNLPSLSEIRWNRELLNGFADAGNESKTERLAVEATLLERAGSLTVGIVDRWLAGRALVSAQVDELNAIAQEAGNVWKRERASPDPSNKGESQPDIGDLASALKLLCGNALPRLFTSADMSLAAFLGDTLRSSLLKTVGVGYWRLLGTDLDEKVVDLVATVEHLHSLLGLRLREKSGGEIAWDARRPGQTVAQAAQAADRAHEAHLNRSMRSALKAVRGLGFVAEVERVEAKDRQSLIWPSDDVVVAVQVRSLFSWLGAAPLIVDIAKSEFDSVRTVVVVPRRVGHLVPSMALRTLTTSDGLAFPAVEQAERFVARRGAPTLAPEVGPAIMRSLTLEAAAQGIAQLESKRPLREAETDSLSRIETHLASGLEDIQRGIEADQTGLLSELFDTFLALTSGSTASESLTAIAQGNADEAVGLLTLLQVAETEIQVDSESARTELERLSQGVDLGGANAVIAALPGIPTDCFDYIERVDGLMARLDSCRRLDEFSTAVEVAVETGDIPRIVADHINVWNEFKARSSTFVDEYASFHRRDSRRWVEAGLPQTYTSDVASAQRTKTGRNDQCPCGSERKYKLCHGR